MLSRRAGIGASSTLIGNLSRSAYRQQRPLRGNIPVIALLVRSRPLATETSTSSSGNNYPPPGFDANAAKKPLSSDSSGKSEGSRRSHLEAEPKQNNDALKNQARIPTNSPTSDPKTRAAELQTLTELATEKAASDKADAAKVAEKKKEEKKLTLWQKVKKEANHYWDGTKLLVTEVRISSKLALKMAAGYELTRRETRQVSTRSIQLRYLC